MAPLETQAGQHDRDAAGGPYGDAALVRRFLAGEERAFDLLVRRHEGTVRAVLYRLVGSAEDAEDLAQETFLRAFHHLPRVRDAEAARAWLLKIAANLARDQLRRRRRKPVEVRLAARAAGEIPARPADAPGAGAHARELSLAVAAALSALSFKQRAALVMKVVADMRYDEISRTLGSSPAAVKANVHLARKRLAALLEDEITAD